MKELETLEMSKLQGGIDNRSCMIAGGAAFFSLWWPPVALGIIAAAALSGCFSQ